MFNINGIKKVFIAKVLKMIVISLIILVIDFSFIIKADYNMLKDEQTKLDYSIINQNSSMAGLELENNRTKNSKTIKYENGVSEVEFYKHAIHYLNNEKYERIDNTLIESDGYLINNKNSFHIICPKTIDSRTPINISYDEYYINIYYDIEPTDAILDISINRDNYNIKDKLSYYINDNEKLEYVVIGDLIKENIILNEYKDNYKFSYIVETPLELIKEDGCLHMYDDSKLCFKYNKYVMYDKGLNVSSAIDIEIEHLGDNKYKIIGIPSNDYLQNAQYPVTIDPEIRIVDGGLIDGLISVYEHDKLYNTETLKTLGYFSINNRNYQISSDDLVANIDLCIPQIYNINIGSLLNRSQLMYAYIEMPTVSNNVLSDALVNLKYGNEVIDQVSFHNNNVFNHLFNIMDIVSDRINDLASGDIYINLELSIDGASNSITNYSLGYDLTGDKPIIRLGYRDDAGISSYFTYEEFLLNEESSFYIAHNSGNFTHIYNDYEGDALFSLQHYFNTSRRGNSIYGNGFNLNYNEYLVDNNQNIVLYGGDGKIVDYKLINNQFIATDGSGQIIEIIYSENSILKYELTDGNIVKEYNNSGQLSVIYFNKNQRVNNTWPSDASKIVLTYGNDKIIRIEDSYGNYISLLYLSNQLQEVMIYKYNYETLETNLLLYIEYTYNNGRLINIVKHYGTEISCTYYSYDSNYHITQVTNNGKGYIFNYDNLNRIVNIQTYNSSSNYVNELSITYHNSGKETQITNLNNQNTNYSFDNYYHTIKIEDSDNNTSFYKYVDIYHDNNGNIINNPNYLLNNKIEIESNSFKNNTSLLDNHSFEIIEPNTIYGWIDDSIGLSNANIIDTDPLFGTYSLALYKEGNNLSCIHQDFFVEQGLDYQITAYIKNIASGIGAYIDIVGIDGIITPTYISNYVNNSIEYNKYEYVFTATFTGMVRLYLINESAGYAYFDHITINSNYIDTNYNYLLNGSFEKGLSTWNGYGLSIDNNLTSSNCGHKLILLNSLESICQTINISGDAGDSFVFGGYAQYENYTGNLVVTLSFNTSNIVYSKSYTYDNPINHSEYYMTKFIAPCDYDSITFTINNTSISSYIFVDNFSLYKDKYGITLEYNNVGKVTAQNNEITSNETYYEYDNNNQIISITYSNNNETTITYNNSGKISMIESQNIVCEYLFDSYDNITSINYNAINSNICYSYGTFDYTANGQYLNSFTDVYGNTNTYTFDYLTGLLNYVVDSNGKYNEYQYTETGQISSLKEGQNYSSKITTYTYNNAGLIESISIGSLIYTFIYDGDNRLSSISLNNNSVVSYTYDYAHNNPNEISSIAYPYGVVYIEYNNIGLISSIYYDNNIALEYIYNDYGEVSIIKDYIGDATYYYNYDYYKNTYTIKADNGNSIKYEYDSDSKLISKANKNSTMSYSYTDVSQSNNYENYKISYEDINELYQVGYYYLNDAYANLESICLYYDNSLLLTKGITNEQITINNQLFYSGRIKQINYVIGLDELLYDYSYDEYNNITKVEAYTNNILTYQEINIYDAFNELIVQRLNINGINYLIEYGYDASGNVEGYYIQNLTTNSFTSDGGFTYNNQNQLISAYLEGINYTNTYQNGLPINYFGYTLSYNNGQISSLIKNNNSYYYDYNGFGNRTSKTINGIVTNYILNGNQIIQEIKGNMIIDYYYDYDETLLGFSYNNQEYAYIKNLQNDIIGIVDSNGNIIVKYYYDGYGNILSIIDTSGINLSHINPFRYRSYYMDDETGWYYLDSRYYNPLVKRFITSDDPIYLGNTDVFLSYNLYLYCHNNPTSKIDVSGNDAILVIDYAAFPVFGHAALFYQISENEWWLTQYGGDKKDKTTAIVMTDYVGTIENVYKKIKNGKCKTVYIRGDFTRVHEFNKDFGAYHLIRNNCLTYVIEALKHGIFYYTDQAEWFLSRLNVIIPSTFLNGFPYHNNTTIPEYSGFIGGKMFYVCIS